MFTIVQDSGLPIDELALLLAAAAALLLGIKDCMMRSKTGHSHPVGDVHDEPRIGL